MHKLQETGTFVVKAQIKRHPLFTTLVMALTNALLLSVILNIHDEHVPKSGLDVWGSFWLGTQSQSSIGYGDVVPHTHIGRITCVFLPILGLLIMSQLLNTFQSYLSASHKEKKAMQKIWDHCVVRHKLEEISAVLIQRRWKLHHSRLKHVYNIHIRMQYISHLLKFRRYFGVILNEEVFLETMIGELSGSMEQKVLQMKPIARAARKVEKLAVKMCKLEAEIVKTAIRSYKLARKCREYLTGGSSPSLTRLSSASQSNNYNARRSTRKMKLQIIQRIASIQETMSPDEPPSSTSLFRKRR